MNKNEIKYWVGFSLIPGIGAARGNKIVNYFDSMKNAWEASETDLVRSGIEESVARNILKERKEIDLEKEMSKIEKEGIFLLTIKDKKYPKALKEIYNPPFLLYVKGEILPEDDYAFAIVGARKSTDYGRQVTRDLSISLAQNNITVISGLAAGVDSVAHNGALSVDSGRTIAVLGSGIDQASIYPAENRQLVQRISSGKGAVISEYPIGTPPLKQNFPTRNRIISGLSSGVLVVEATTTSGSLITAQFALEQGREVFAIPGSIYNKNAGGPNSLIKKGAKLVENIDDILEELHFKNIISEIETKKIVASNENEEKIIKILEYENKHIDEIARETGIPIAELNGLLVTMEMKGFIRNINGGNYTIQR
uniref:DNA-protecting protein DprA n=1 Tax=candidate division CPR3 bacterium TaxID=2268181 RepID=A0A7C4R9W6_UNCC3